MMKNRKRLIPILVFILLIILAAWYFFLKRWDYKVIFTVPAHSSLAYTFIKDHRDWNGKTLKPEQIQFLQEEPWFHLQSELDLQDTNYVFDWHLKQKNDSLTKISVGVMDKERDLVNRLSILLNKTDFEVSIRKNVTIIRDKIIERNKEFKYRYNGVDSISEIPCVYIPMRSSVRQKADEMIRNVITINMFVKDNNLGLNGDPMVVVKNWTPLSDSIDFDFCFPILHPGLVPPNPDIKVGTVSCRKALNADFFGNYSYSDYSWYRLFEKIQKENLETSGRIIEVFYNDPHNGGDDHNWKAGIYMELQN